MMTHDLLARSAERRPDAALLIDGARTATYREVEEGANRTARLLRDLGTRRGDRVGLLVPNSVEYVMAYYGALRAGSVVVPLHPASDARTLRRLLADCGAVGCVAATGPGERLARAAEELPEMQWAVMPEPGSAAFPAHLRVVASSAAASLPNSTPDVGGIDIDRATIIYTSGSTGRPRGAILSHLNVVANTRSILAYLGLTAADRVLCALPFPYVYGKSLLNTHVAVGGSLVLHDLTFPESALEAMAREEVTGFSGVPSTFAILLNRSSLAQRRFPALRYVTQAGGGMPVPHIKRLIEALPGVRIFVMYGATEAAARLSWLPPEQLDSHIGSIGRAIPNVELTIRRDDGAEAEIGEVGEIVARGSNIMEGYWGDAIATAEVLGPDGFHTGDLGSRDAEGYFWVTGRKREMIKSGAHRVSPREIEEALLEHPDVEEAAVVGAPDEYLGESIVAYVTVRPGSERSGEALRRFCVDRLPTHKVPHRVLVREEMPRNPSGKLDKRALKGELEQS